MEQIAGDAPIDGAPLARGQRRSERRVLVAARGGGALFAGRLFQWVVRFGIGVLLARVLGADGFGLYSLAISIATLTASLPTLGLDSALVRFTAIAAARRQPAQLRADLRFVLSLSCVLSLIAVSVIFVSAGTIAETALHDARLTPLLLISGLVVPSVVLNAQLGAALQGMRRIEYAALAELFSQPVVRLVLVLALLVVVGLTPASALVAWLGASFAATIILAWLLRRMLPPAPPGQSARPRAWELLRYSLPVFLSNIVHRVGGNLQTLFLGALSTVSAVGIFSVAAHLNMIGSVFHSAIVSSSMALFAEAEDRGDRRGLESLYQTVSKWSISLNLPLVLIVFLFPEALLAMFGPEFSEGTGALMILAGANLANAATGTSGAVLDMTGHTGVKLLNAILGLGLALGLNLLLIPPLGIIGAAIAVVASTSAVNVLRVVEVGLLLKTSPYNATFYKLIVAGSAGLVLALAWKAIAGTAPMFVTAAVGIPLLLATYLFVLIKLGLSPEDRQVLDRVAKRLFRRGKGEKPVR